MRPPYSGGLRERELLRMTRTAAREIVARLCFELPESVSEVQDWLAGFFEEEYYQTLASEDEVFSVYPDQKQMKYISALVNGIAEHNAELDGYIEKYSKSWKFDRISKTARAIMKTAMFEVLYMPDVPNNVAINEAIELAKKYEESATVSFVNGVLGGFVKNEII